MPKLISRFLKEELTWEQTKEVYQFGDRYQRELAEINDDEPASGSPDPGRAELKMLLRRHAPDAWDMDNPEKNREWGNLVHMAMAKIVDAIRFEERLRGGTDNV